MRALPSSLPPYGIWVVLGAVAVMILLWFAVGARRRRGPTTAPAPAVPGAPVASAAGPWEAAAQRAVGRAATRLVGQRYSGLVIASVFHYGAVDLGTQHLVVWVLVSGPRSEEIPGWWSPGAPAATPLPAGWEGWLASVVDAVRDELAAVGWPDARDATVLVDSDERVRRTGFDYFR
ncbi:MAG: hypothetical protein U0S36_14420 [Candidatus Nanopelagicales bacterium]